MSFTQWFTRSAPTVLWIPVSKAILSFVPTPSADATRIGSPISGNAPENIPPKLPISVSVLSLNVLRANSRIFATARLALSIETPASEYEIDRDINSCYLNRAYPKLPLQNPHKLLFRLNGRF